MPKDAYRINLIITAGLRLDKAGDYLYNAFDLRQLAWASAIYGSGNDLYP